jgi:hypothetical protein
MVKTAPNEAISSVADDSVTLSPLGGHSPGFLFRRRP